VRVRAWIVGAVFALGPGLVQAQQNRGGRVSAHALLGVFAPTGRHRNAIGDAFAIGGQLGIGVRPSMAVVGGALISQMRYRATPQGELTVVQYDVGLEFAPASALASAHNSPRRRMTPFLGAGAGARTYELTERTEGTRVFLSGYVSVGTEFSIGSAGLRLEARDYVSGSELSGTLSGARNDVTAVAGLAYHFR
jgi:hypothetical protein